MKTTLAILAATGFLGVAVFGFSYMHVSGQAHDGGCIAAAAYGADCPTEAKPLEFAAFHFGALRNLASAAGSPQAGAARTSPISVGFSVLASPPPRYVVPRYHSESAYSLRSEKLTRWLVLHENSPTIA
ncbi:MAG: hypothetical protein Q7S84_02840 [bacterium]|nr:hypothetical protein [bacterium]